ncbi:Crp/Fnr family transcriptional regulator [Streptantibioticus rubrisoli]|uniref:Cyclic nucleotide-binding domain-containing protein n=1 Tax=Streptantibioticus rubrisoli TaxID=1387313 RepID=A0ABT1PAA3_9ACTN|nr:cyclic nucleotide-binding domain-containing protein [Streptantibioticus rubrisoli]MCQ4042302.1 cyclic nucleotide-binding domain-containing protein [Streptantibioticus rubrisoli]
MTEGFLSSLPPTLRGWLLGFAHDTAFPGDIRLFEEGSAADRFWLVRTGLIALDVHIPGRGAIVVETIGDGELLGWSWLFEPYQWHLGALTRTAVQAYEFDAPQVRAAMDEDPAAGLALFRAIGDQVIGRRLRSARTRLLDLYGPDTSRAYESGPAR